MKTTKFFKTRRCVGEYSDYLKARFAPEVKTGSVEQAESHFIEQYHVLLQVVTDQGIDLPEPIVRQFPTMKMRGGVPSITEIVKWNKNYRKWRDQLPGEFRMRLWNAPTTWFEIA